jgi:hypothetical protein
MKKNTHRNDQSIRCLDEVGYPIFKYSDVDLESATLYTDFAYSNYYLEMPMLRRSLDMRQI